MSNNTDYLYATGRIRSLELGLLNDERMERMLLAKTNDEALKVLTECGYGDVLLTSLADIDSVILSQRQKAYELIGTISVDKNLFDVLKIKYDYHNIKVIIKSMDKEYAHLFIASGRINPEQLDTIIRESDYFKLNTTMSKAVIEAKEIIARTNNPQLSDFILDHASYLEMKAAAEKTNSKFIVGYVKLLVDVNNLRAFIRCSRMNKGSDLLRYAIFEGGDIDISKLLTAVDDAEFKAESIYAMTDLDNAATIGDSALGGEKSLTVFEKICDNALMEYLKKAKYVPYGEEPIFAYLAAKESEFTAVRTILSGRLSNVSTDIIRERLRNAYV